MDNAMLIEIWTRLKPLIPQKDRLDAADKLVAVFDEYGELAEDALSVAFDKELKAAFANVYGVDVDDEEEEDDEWY